jgi:hypothetical protein
MGDLIRKIMTRKRAGGMAQVVDHLSGKHKALTPNPNTSDKKQKPK